MIYIDADYIVDSLEEQYFGKDNKKYTPKVKDFLFAIRNQIITKDEDGFEDVAVEIMVYFVRNEKLIIIKVKVEGYSDNVIANSFKTLDEVDKKSVQIDFEKALKNKSISSEQYKQFFEPYEEFE